jgi:cell division protein FtsL
MPSPASQAEYEAEGLRRTLTDFAERIFATAIVAVPLILVAVAMYYVVYAVRVRSVIAEAETHIAGVEEMRNSRPSAA